MLIRCSSLPKIMTAPRSKSEVLSETAKSYIKQQAKEDFYGYSTELDNKYVNKGIMVEEQSIQLLNDYGFTDYSKHVGRVNTDLLTGECDILTDDSIIDIKSSWSLDTFPALEEDVDVKVYEWQMRGYMHLYNKDVAYVCYCMVDTPNSLIGYENEDIHKVSHLEISKRITMIKIMRDMALEEQMLERCKLAQDFYIEYVNKLNNK